MGKKMFEVQLYVEMHYPHATNWEERISEGLPDYNITFLTKHTFEEFEEMIAEAEDTLPDFKDFMSDYKDEINDISIEYHCPQEEGLEEPEEDDCFIEENWCGNA
jgi:hypothetical protein